MNTEDLNALGLEQEVIDKVFALNGKDVEAEKAKAKKAENERDNYKTQLDTAKEALSKFDGVNVDDCRASDYYHWRCVSYVRLFSEKVKNSDR